MGASGRSRLDSGWPSTSSITRKGRGVVDPSAGEASPKSKTLATPGWCSEPACRASVSKRVRNSASSAYSGLRTLIAT